MSSVVSIAAGLDDVVIYSSSWTEYVATLNDVFDRLAEASLTLTPRHCWGRNAIHLQRGLQLPSESVTGEGVCDQTCCFLINCHWFLVEKFLFFS